MKLFQMVKNKSKIVNTFFIKNQFKIGSTLFSKSKSFVLNKKKKSGINTVFIIYENFALGLQSIFLNKSRSLLSMLGIVIGIAAVIIVTSLGASATYSVKANLESIGTSNIILFSRTRTQLGATLASKYFDKTLGEDLKEYIPGIRYTISNLSRQVTVKYGNTNETYTLKATIPDWININSYKPKMGRFLDKTDYNKFNIVIGNTVASELFGGEEPIGKKLQLIITNRMFTCTVVGVMESKTRSFIGDFDNEIYLLYETYNNKIQRIKTISQIILVAENAEVASSIVDTIKYYLNRLAGLDANNDEQYYRVMSMGDLISSYNSIIGTLTLLLGGVAAISLIVGGIGIMNIMLVSVTERTKEIGIRKALGARNSYILLQFLMESSLISVLGGIIGIFLGIGLNIVIDYIAGWKFIINWGALLFTVIFSLLIGNFFGLYPARKAAKLHPVEALMYE